jgi:hypothetical protein
VKEMADELPVDVPKADLTEQDLRDFYVKKNLMDSFQRMIAKYSAVGQDGFINHVIADTGILYTRVFFFFLLFLRINWLFLDTLSGIALRYPKNTNTNTKNTKNTKKNTKKYKKYKNKQQKHTLTITRYGVSVDDIRKANLLVGTGDQAFYKLMVLRIPVNENQMVPERG